MPLVLLAAAIGGLTLVNLIVGWKHRGAGPGAVGRLLWVAGALAALAALPVAVWAALEVSGLGRAEPVVVGLALCITAILGALYLLPTSHVVGGWRDLPPVTDAAFLDRLNQLAGRMELAAPAVRLLPSLSGSQAVMAWAGGLAAPQIVVTDGLLRRLDARECDAIVAHELGHIANGSLWLPCWESVRPPWPSSTPCGAGGRDWPSLGCCSPSCCWRTTGRRKRWTWRRSWKLRCRAIRRPPFLRRAPCAGWDGWTRRGKSALSPRSRTRSTTRRTPWQRAWQSTAASWTKRGG